MDNTKHTPGPWLLTGAVQLVGNPDSENGQHNLYVGEIRHPDHIGAVCYIQSADHCPNVGIVREVAEANARLIAAAPELVAFAEAVVAVLENCQRAGLHLDLDKQAFLKEARLVIAKATGAAA